MTDLRKKSLRGIITNVIVDQLAFACFLSFPLTLSDNNYRRKLVPMIWQIVYLFCWEPRLNLTMGFLGAAGAGAYGLHGYRRVYRAAFPRWRWSAPELFTANTASPLLLIGVMLGCLLGALLAGIISLLMGIPARCACAATIWRSLRSGSG